MQSERTQAHDIPLSKEFAMKSLHRQVCLRPGFQLPDTEVTQSQNHKPPKLYSGYIEMYRVQMASGLQLNSTPKLLELVAFCAPVLYKSFLFESCAMSLPLGFKYSVGGSKFRDHLGCPVTQHTALGIQGFGCIILGLRI